MSWIPRPGIARRFDLSDIVGLEHVKDVVTNAVHSPHPVALLLVGPPESAKSMLLEKIAEYFGFNGGVPFTFDWRVTPVGLAEALYLNRNARAYVFDEVDKCRPEVLTVFNEAVEHRRVTVLKARHQYVVKLNRDAKFFAGANDYRALASRAQATITRFLEVPVPAFSEDQFTEVIVRILTRKEYGGFSESDARMIAQVAWNEGFRRIRAIRELGKIYPGKPAKVVAFLRYHKNTRGQTHPFFRP